MGTDTADAATAARGLRGLRACSESGPSGLRSYPVGCRPSHILCPGARVSRGGASERRTDLPRHRSNTPACGDHPDGRRRTAILRTAYGPGSYSEPLPFFWYADYGGGGVEQYTTVDHFLTAALISGPGAGPSPGVLCALALLLYLIHPISWKRSRGRPSSGPRAKFCSRDGKPTWA